jgi:hypothetical protein
MKDAASDGILGDQAEEPLDQIDPGGRSRREVEMEAPVTFEPCLDLGMLVGARCPGLTTFSVLRYCSGQKK